MIVTLIIEKSDAGFLGRVEFEEDLIIAQENTIGKLETKIGKILAKNHSVNTDTLTFQHRYDLSSLFDKFDFLKISSVARMAGLNDSLLRQYVTGSKHASAAQAKKIETTIRRIGKDLVKVQVGGKEGQSKL